MDLSTVEEKLRRGAYATPAAFRNDIELIVYNALLYNGAGSPVGRNASRALQNFIKEWDRWQRSKAKKAEQAAAAAAVRTIPVYTIGWVKVPHFSGFWPAMHVPVDDVPADARRALAVSTLADKLLVQCFDHTYAVARGGTWIPWDTAAADALAAAGRDDEVMALHVAAAEAEIDAMRMDERVTAARAGGAGSADGEDGEGGGGLAMLVDNAADPASAVAPRSRWAPAVRRGRAAPATAAWADGTGPGDDGDAGGAASASAGPSEPAAKRARRDAASDPGAGGDPDEDVDAEQFE